MPPTPDRMQQIAERRAHVRQQATEQGTLPPAEEELTPAQVEAKLRALEPRAVRVLERQLRSPDERVAQGAAQLLLEWNRGKPTTNVKQTTDQVTTVRYESAAWRPLDHEISEHDPALLNGG